MSTTPLTLEKCLGLLEQAIVLVEMIDDDTFSEPAHIAPHGSIATHLRHILGFYDSFISGLEHGRVDYNARTRDQLLEHNRRHAINSISVTIERIRSLSQLPETHSLFVATEEDENKTSGWSRSSVLRELDFLQSHTIHHYSLIAILLRLRGIDPGPEFGVAPSTLNHWSEEAVCAP